ncbi:alpha/beta-hydrolase [Annulohypoxylon maeteangense]|uniref:alpha/beta-hydrolase n=1 Tax=Annulohypoxylon maeteangense TaxID=1927788 RepID=UPI002007DF97|nr:alpha/beta-hydrolase [Annulohypoxylon maeteangense]KAI0880436.1 alpha/beta-hydrolase [Annulohypoxylon maeteangense]
MELGCSVVAPLEPHKHTHTVVFLHGRGDTSQNMADALLRWTRDSRGRTLIDEFPSVRWVFPQAEPSIVETTGEEWPQWFDIWNILDMTDREELQALGLKESVESVRRIVRREARAVGGYDRVVLAGISQGGATAAHVLLHLGALEDGEGGESYVEKSVDADAKAEEDRPPKLCGLMGFSAWLPFPGGSLDETREVLGLEEFLDSKSDELVRNTPVFVGHCENDPLVFIEYGQQLRDGLESFGMKVKWHEYPDGGHWFNAPFGMDDAVEFLKAQGIPMVKQ